MDFINISWMNSKMLYGVIYFKISTFVHTFLDGNTLHCKVLCIVHYRVRSLLVPKNHGFVKTELPWKPNFRDGPEAVFSNYTVL